MFADMMMRFGNEASREVIDDRYFNYHPMMWWAGGTNAFWFFGLLWLITWILVMVALIAIIRWLWRKGDKVK